MDAVSTSEAPSWPTEMGTGKIARRAVAAGLFGLALGLSAQARACPPLLRRQFLRLQDEKPQDLCQYAGRVLVIVNTASHCGYTPQYKSLEALHQRWTPRGLTVLGFPSNDFGQQEPGSNAQIAEFCESTFGVRFPMFAKSHVAANVAAATRNPLFADLARLSGEAPRWNFHKYLISRDGQEILSFPSRVDPSDRVFQQAVERLIGA